MKITDRIKLYTAAGALTLAGLVGGAFLSGCDEENNGKPTVQETFEQKTFADYPYLLQDQNGNLAAYIVVGDNAPASDVIAAVDVNVALNNMLGQSAECKLASEIGTLEQKLILVGRNSAYAPGQENPYLDNHTIPALNPGEGYLAIEKVGDNYHVIVSGYDTVDVRKAGRALADHLDELSGKRVIVQGTTLTDLTFQVLE